HYVSAPVFREASNGAETKPTTTMGVALMKCVLGILAVAVVLAAGGVAAYDYTIGGVGIFGSCPSCSASSEAQAPCCSMCCEQDESNCTEACPACAGEKAECPSCPGLKAAKECPSCPASAAPSGDK